MLNRQMKFASVVLLSALLVFVVSFIQPATPAFAGITPTAKTESPTDVPPTDVPPTDVPPTAIPPTAVPPKPSNPQPSNSQPPAATETPIPTPEAIPDLGAGPNLNQTVVTGAVLLSTILFLAVSWWKTWQLYRQE